MTKILITLSIVMSLIGCKSVGTQYAPPTATEPHATIKTNDSDVLILSFGDDGCYSGRTHIAPGTPFNLSPDKETVITYESSGGMTTAMGTEFFCRIVLSFIPQENEQYIFKASYIFEPNSRRVASCTASINKITPEGSMEPVKTTQLKMSQKRLTCIKAIPVRK
jgi:hypothetical protein